MFEYAGFSKFKISPFFVCTGMCVTTVYMSCLEGVLDQWEVHYQLVLRTFVICFVQHLIHLIS